MSGGGRALAAHVAGIVGDGPAESLTAVQAAQRILAWRDAVHTLSAIAEAQVMEAAWAIRREHSDRDAFGAFVERNLGDVLDADRAWSMAETWDAARRNRQLRELARRRPEEAVAFVRDFAESADGALDDDDREAVELLSAPPRQRRARLRELQADARAAGEGRNPADVRRIAELEAERDEAVFQARLAGPVADPAETLAEDERRLAARADEIDALRGKLSAAAADRLLRVADMAMGSLERIMSALQGGSG